MRELHDIREVIGERDPSPEERRAMETTAQRLSQRLAEDVPFRPEFQAELRRQLIARARQSLTPWYRRHSVMGPILSVSAAAAILALGFSFFWEGPAESPVEVVPPPVVEVPINPQPPQVQPTLVRQPGELKLVQVSLPDEVLPPGYLAPASVTLPDLSKGLPVYQSVVLTDDAQFERIAAGLGLTAPPIRTDQEIFVMQGLIRLSLTPTGLVSYVDRSQPAESSDQPADAESAAYAAQRFLRWANLPAPYLPTVTEDAQEPRGGDYLVIYTPRVDNYPLVNGRTVIRVDRQNRVVEATAYVQASEESRGMYGAERPTAALAAAQAMGGGTFDQQELVYVRTPNADGDIFLQPFWRIFGTDGRGNRIARYVPALKDL